MTVFPLFGWTLGVALAAALAGGIFAAATGKARFWQPPWWSIAPFAVLWAGAFAWLSVLQHNGFRTHAYDLGIYDQVIWNTSQGRLFENSIMHFLPHFLGDHFSLALLLLAPLYWMWPDPRTLLILQPICLAAAALPIAYYGTVKLKSGWFGLAIGLAFLLHPGNAFTTLFDFHDIVLAPPLIALSLALLLTGHPRGFALALLPILLIKEEMGIVVVAAGLWAAVFTKYRRTGIVVAGVAVAWLAFVFLVAIPAFNPDGQYYYLRRYFDAGEPGGGSTATVNKFVGLATGLLTPEKLAYLAHLVVPFALLPLFGLPSLIAVPTLGYHLLSPEFPFAFIEKHYSVLVLPMLAIGAVDGAYRLGRWFPAAGGAFAPGVAAAGVCAYLLLSPGPMAGGFQPDRFAPYDRTNLITAAATMIPADGRLMAQTDLVPHFSRRQTVYMFPDSPGFGNADWVLLDLAGSKYPLSNPEDDYDRAIQQFILNPDFDVVYDQNYIMLLQRRARPDEPTVPLNAEFSRRIALDGYRIDTPDIQAGGVLSVTLWWRALMDVPDDNLVFLHLNDANGTTVAQSDIHPTEDWFPTGMWEAGRRFRVTYPIAIPASARPGTYLLDLGLYGQYSLRRLALPDGANSIRLPDPITLR